MTSKFTTRAKDAVRQLAPEAGDSNGYPGYSRFPVAEVCRALNLPEMPHARFLNEQSWMIGGAVLRWLSGESSGRRAGGGVGDFDFAFPSLEALRRTQQAMTDQGYVFSRHVAFDPDRRLTRGQVVRKVFTGVSPDAGKVQLIKEGERGSVAVELISPEGDLIQLITLYIKPSPVVVISECDFSICQFALDGPYLYAGPSALHDLLNYQLRLGYVRHPPTTLRRIIKYMRRGFRPDARTVLTVSAGVWRWYKSYFGEARRRRSQPPA
jgi:hypothetical protein